MSRLNLFLIFILVNALGYFTVHACYVIGLTSSVIVSQGLDFNAIAKGILLTWLVCAIFSVSAFFVGGAGRIFFLAAPILIPMAYGLKLLFLS